MNIQFKYKRFDVFINTNKNITQYYLKGKKGFIQITDYFDKKTFDISFNPIIKKNDNSQYSNDYGFYSGIFDNCYIRNITYLTKKEVTKLNNSNLLDFEYIGKKITILDLLIKKYIFYFL